jgi:hypothetical protein
MKAEELMIGDWVRMHYPFDMDIDMRPERINVLTKGVDIDCEAIPLTSEILEKNGWKDISDHTLKGCETFKLHYEQRSFDFYITIKLRDYFKLESYDDRFYTLCEMEFGCRFVHQLQHALRLCGIDKEIVL